MSTSRTLALAALCALAPAAAPTPAVAQGRYQAQGAAQRHFQEGDALQARGDRARADGDQKGAREAFKDAVSRFRKAIEADPGYVDAYARIGRLYYDLDQPDEAIPLLRAGLKRQADSVDLQFWLGQHLLRARDGKAPKPEQLEEGLALLRQVVGATDRFPEAHLVLANHLYDTGDFAGASGHYERYLAANPDAHNIRARLGNAYVKQQRHADALGAFRRVHEAKPDDVAVTINLGTAHFNLGQYEDAVKLLEAALKRDPNRQSALFNLAQSYFQLGRFAEAVPIYQRFTAAKPKSFNGWYF
ncbi:MAG: tetratricopeptide repeat protein, partial [Myxococcales bacterium]|nr:tetratricopeptide repeat protein [Myxococcales bacterium]